SFRLSARAFPWLNPSEISTVGITVTANVLTFMRISSRLPRSRQNTSCVIDRGIRGITELQYHVHAGARVQRSSDRDIGTAERRRATGAPASVAEHGVRPQSIQHKVNGRGERGSSGVLQRDGLRIAPR